MWLLSGIQHVYVRIGMLKQSYWDAQGWLSTECQATTIPTYSLVSVGTYDWTNYSHRVLHITVSFVYIPVYFYNYGWMDYGVPTLESVLDMVKVVDFAVREGKVAIHCHAGLGRTGVLIACYLIYSKRMRGDEAIAVVRERRLEMQT